MLHHKLPAEPNCSHSTRQSINSRQLKSNFHSIRLAPDCELGERGRRATFSWPKPHATEAERPCAYDAVRARPLCRLHRPQRCVATAMAQLSQGSLARARSRRRSWQQQRFHGSLGAGGHCSRGAVAVRRAMGYSFIGSYQSASGALPLCDPRPLPSASCPFRASFYAFIGEGGRRSHQLEPPLKGGKCVRP